MASKATSKILKQKKLTNVRRRRNAKSIINPLAKKQQIQASVSLLADSSKVSFGSKLCFYCLIWHSILNWYFFAKEIKVLLWGYDRKNKLLERKRCIYFVFITERRGEVDQFAILDVVIEMPIGKFHQILPIYVNGTKFGKTKSLEKKHLRILNYFLNNYSRWSILHQPFIEHKYKSLYSKPNLQL